MTVAILHVNIESVKSQSLTLGSFLFLSSLRVFGIFIYTAAETDVCGFCLSYLFTFCVSSLP